MRIVYKLDVLIFQLKVAVSGERDTMLKFGIVLCAVNLFLVTNASWSLWKESHPQMTNKLTRIYQDTVKIYRNFNDSNNLLLLNLANESLRRFDDLISGTIKLWNGTAEFHREYKNGSLECLKYYSNVALKDVESKMEKCLEEQKIELQNFSGKLTVNLTDIMMVDMLNGSQNCESKLVNKKSKSSVNESLVCYEQLYEKVKKRLRGLTEELTRIEKSDILDRCLNYHVDYYNFLQRTMKCLPTIIFPVNRVTTTAPP